MRILYDITFLMHRSFTSSGAILPQQINHRLGLCSSTIPSLAASITSFELSLFHPYNFRFLCCMSSSSQHDSGTIRWRQLSWHSLNNSGTKLVNIPFKNHFFSRENRMFLRFFSLLRVIHRCSFSRRAPAVRLHNATKTRQICCGSKSIWFHICCTNWFDKNRCTFSGYRTNPSLAWTT